MLFLFLIKKEYFFIYFVNHKTNQKKEKAAVKQQLTVT